MPSIPPDKTYYKGNVKYEEYHNRDGSLRSYHTTERTDDYRITCDYLPDGSLLYREKICYNRKGILFKEEIWNNLEKGKEVCFETFIPIFEGFEDSSNMSDEDKKKHSILIRQYLSAHRKKYDPSSDVPW